MPRFERARSAALVEAWMLAAFDHRGGVDGLGGVLFRDDAIVGDAHLAFVEALQNQLQALARVGRNLGQQRGVLRQDADALLHAGLDDLALGGAVHHRLDDAGYDVGLLEHDRAEDGVGRAGILIGILGDDISSALVAGAKHPVRGLIGASEDHVGAGVVLRERRFLGLGGILGVVQIG